MNERKRCCHLNQFARRIFSQMVNLFCIFNLYQDKKKVLFSVIKNQVHSLNAYRIVIVNMPLSSNALYTAMRCTVKEKLFHTTSLQIEM